VGEPFEAARDDDALREVERALSLLGRREQRWQAYERFAVRAEVALQPPELWLLARLGERKPLTKTELVEALRVDGEAVLEALVRLRERGHAEGSGDGEVALTDVGRADYERIVAARSERLAELLAGWHPEHERELQELIDRLGRDLVAAIPTPPGVAG
jgi:DNA-binding MarR family transcriptional regulator